MKKLGMTLLCLMAVNGTASARHLGRTPLQENYDRFKDRTTVSTQRVLLSSGFRKLGIGNSLLSFTYGCPGQDANCQPDSVVVVVEAFRSIGGWLFIGSHQLDFLADGNRIIIETRWDGNVGSGHEWMVGEIAPQELHKLSVAEKVEVKLGEVEFKRIPSKDREAWIALADKIENKEN